MKLAIVVVYLVGEDDGPLLDLHLSQIRNCTKVPYEIYASANRLLPRFRERLDSDPNVRVCPCPPTELRGFREHSFYLEELIRIAIDDGATHVLMLNPDSFPVKEGWVREMADGLSDATVLSAVRRDETDDHKPHPSCLLFPREFYLRYGPRILMSDEEIASERGQAYQREFHVILDTCAGYGFKLYCEGLGWNALLRSNRAADHYVIGSVYGDLVFHLGGANRAAKIHMRERRMIEHSFGKRSTRALNRLMRMGAKVLPERARAFFRPYRGYVLAPGAQLALDASQRAFDSARRQLIQDPDSYFRYLRTGRRD